MSKLTVDDIKQGAFIWYSGFTLQFGWNCPAVITKVDKKAMEFFVMSLDDMRVQNQSYDIHENEHSPDSRKNMRLATHEEVHAFLNKQEANLNAEISESPRALAELEKARLHFRTERSKLFPTEP